MGVGVERSDARGLRAHRRGPPDYPRVDSFWHRGSAYGEGYGYHAQGCRVCKVMADSTERLTEVLSRLSGVKREGQRFRASCPAHADGTPSLSVRLGDRGILIRCYAGCTHRDVIAALGLREEELFYDFDPDRRDKAGERDSVPREESETGLTRAAFGEQRKLDDTHLANCGVYDGIVAGKRVLLFAYAARDGSPGRTRIRTALTGKDRFRWDSGESPVLAYEPDGGEKARTQRRVVIVEGESDALTLLQAGFPALGIPGADMSKLITAGHLTGLEAVFVCREPDKGGDVFARQVPLQLERLGYRGQVHVVRMPDGVKDVSALYVREQGTFAAAFESLLAAAAPPRSKSLEELFAHQGEDEEVVLSELSELDRACDDGGIPLGKLVIIVGGPGARKTGLAVQLADVLSRQQCAVLMVCADEGRKNIVRRLGQRLGFNRSGLRDRTEIGAATRAEAARREAALGRVLRFTELDDADDAQTIEEAHAELLSVAKGRPRVLIVDSLQTCRCEAAEALERPDPRQETNRKMRTMLGFRRAGTLVIVLSETRRGFYSSTEKRVEKEDVISAAKESSGVEFGADLVLGIVRDKTDAQLLEIIAAKSRFGEEPRFAVRWDRERAVLSELTATEADEKIAHPPKRGPRPNVAKDELRNDVLQLVLRQPGISYTDIRAAVQRSHPMVKELLEELAYQKLITVTPHKNGQKASYVPYVAPSASDERSGDDE